mmetsp:Transcript_34674/g.42761  ORF Transcript_34674/g.42761 Transcript_34674/m.42761 type:complete len:139 (-) Transcript_34674:42-458(-)
MHPVLDRPYYSNVKTGEATYKRPESLGIEWKEYWDSEAHRSYWKSEVTNEIVYDNPYEIQENQWYEAKTETNETYYYLWNEQRQVAEEIQWEKPNELLTEEEKRVKEYRKWDEFWSTGDGAPYYLNKETGEITWKRPW